MQFSLLADLKRPRLLQAIQAIHKFEQGQHISRLAKTNARSFWKSIKKHYKKKKKINPDATPSPNDFLNHFSEV